MRVVVSSFDPVPAAKGASQHILSTVEILRRDHDVSLVTLGEQPAPGVRHLPLSFDEPNWLRRALLFSERVDAIFRRECFDVHHVRSPFEGLRVPVSSALVAEVNGLYSIETPYHYPGLTAQPGVRTRLRNQELALLDRADRIVTPSPVTARYLSDLGADPFGLQAGRGVSIGVDQDHHVVVLREIHIGGGLDEDVEHLGSVRHLDRDEIDSGPIGRIVGHEIVALGPIQEDAVDRDGIFAGGNGDHREYGGARKKRKGRHGV